jgi:hypothetical protein
MMSADTASVLAVVATEHRLTRNPQEQQQVV